MHQGEAVLISYHCKDESFLKPLSISHFCRHPRHISLSACVCVCVCCFSLHQPISTINLHHPRSLILPSTIYVTRHTCKPHLFTYIPSFYSWWFHFFLFFYCFTEFKWHFSSIKHSQTWRWCRRSVKLWIHTGCNTLKLAHCSTGSPPVCDRLAAIVPCSAARVVVWLYACQDDFTLVLFSIFGE